MGRFPFSASLFLFPLLLGQGWGKEGVISGYGIDLRAPLSRDVVADSFSPHLLESIIVPQYLEEFREILQGDAYLLWDIVDSLLLKNVKSESCKGQAKEFMIRTWGINFTNFPEDDVWALHMVDSWGKWPEGLFSGHVNALGDFDECVDITIDNLKKTADKNNYDTPAHLEGRYCNTFLTPFTKERFGKYWPFFTSSSNSSDLAKVASLQNSLEGRKAISPAELAYFISLAFGVKVFPSFAVCFPHTCEQPDVEQILMNAFHIVYRFPNKTEAENKTWPGVEFCYVGEKPDLDAGDISVIALLAVITGIVIAATVVDILLNRGVEKPPRRGIAYQCLISFSFYTNIPRWLSTRTTADDLGCLHGIRFLSTAWVILAHTWFVIIYIPYWNLADVKTLQDKWSIMTIMNSTVSVDTFFVLSGLLVAFNVLKMLQKTKGKLNIVMFYVHRYLRLTPVYAILIGVMATLVPYTGRGPYWFIMDRWGQICVDNWWTNMLYVNNFVNTSWLCQGEAWYLANDMQFYIVSPIFLLPLYHWEMIGVAILAVATILSCACPLLLVHFLETSPTTIGTKLGQEYVNKWFTDIYIKPYARIQTYFVGIWLGWILFKTKGKRVKLPIPAVIGGWLVSTAICLSVLYGIQDWFDPDYEIPTGTGLAYAGFSRFAWAVAMAWIIFACCKGYGGLINDFLSWKVFMPLGRLCYCVYLVSLHLQMVLHVGQKQATGYSEYTFTNYFFAHMVMAYIVGFFFTLMVETPFMQLEKILLEGAGGGGRGGAGAGGDAQRQGTVSGLPGGNGKDDRNGIFYGGTQNVTPVSLAPQKQE